MGQTKLRCHFNKSTDLGDFVSRGSFGYWRDLWLKFKPLVNSLGLPVFIPWLENKTLVPTPNPLTLADLAERRLEPAILMLAGGWDIVFVSHLMWVLRTKSGSICRSSRCS